jgi:hypothetical protein
MTPISPNKSSSSPTEATSPAVSEEPGRSYGPIFAKGCGCLLICIVLGVGVALVGKGEVASWGSAIVGVLFLVLVMGSSGLTGWWHK